MPDNNELMQEIKDRFKEACDASEYQYRDSVEDLQFIKGGSQWPQSLKSEREADGRPCLEINKLPTFADQVIGDIRQNEPGIKIKPVDSQADPETAEIFGGLIRNIEMQNDAEVAYDTAAESAVICGLGAWRIGTDYADDDQFEQDITIRRIKNPFTIYWDPKSQNFDRSDANYCFVTEKIPREEFKEQYPKAGLTPFDASRDKNSLWGDEKSIRIAEYWKKEPITKKLFLIQKMISDPMTGQGKSGDIMVTEVEPDGRYLDPNEWKILKKKEVKSHKIVWYKVTQSEILEGPVEWSGKYIPIIMCYGKELNIENETIYRGMVRHAKDPSRLYNYARSTNAEVISLAPKAPYLVTAKQISNYQSKWDTAGKKSWPYLPYDVDPGNPAGIPQRATPIGVNTGIQTEVIVADQEIHDTTGLQQANLGQKSNEKSGRAILARQKEGDTANYAFYDNLGRAIKYQGKVLVDLIPKIYDTARVVRILNKDGSDKFVQINQPFQDKGANGQPIEKIYDLTVGKYDVVVTIGPSYATEREEAVENMMGLVTAVPQAGMLISDLLVKNMDWPGADEISKRLRLLLPPQLQQEGGDGNPPPLPPPPPDPMQMIMMKKLEAEAKTAELDAQIKFLQLQRIQAGLPMDPQPAKPDENKTSQSKSSSSKA